MIGNELTRNAHGVTFTRYLHFRFKGIARSYNFKKTNVLFVSQKNCRHLSTKSTLPQVPVFLHAEKNKERPAIVDRDGRLNYGDVLHHSMNLAVEILKIFSANESMKINGERIALLTEPNAAYVVGMYASWICNSISVPLHTSHPPSEWEYFLSDSQCSLILVTQTLLDKISPVAEKLGIPVKIITREAIGEPYERNRWFQPDHASNPK